MSRITLSSNTAGTGNFTIAAPNSNTNRTLTLPDEAGEILTDTGRITINSAAPIGSLNIDASGNVGIGATSPNHRFDVQTPSGTNVVINATKSGTDAVQIGVDTGPYINGGAFLALRVGGSERARIDSAGNVGIGTTLSPQSRLNVTKPGNSTSPNIAITSGGPGDPSTTDPYITFAASGLESLNTIKITTTGAFNSRSLTFHTGSDNAGSERMRITAGGLVHVNGTTTGDSQVAITRNNPTVYNGAHLELISGAGDVVLGFHAAGATAVCMDHIRSSTSLRVVNGNRTAFAPILASAFTVNSDYRIKENLEPLTDASTRIMQLPVHRFSFIENSMSYQTGQIVDGFLAHEVEGVVPEAVLGEKDAVDSDGNPIYQGIDQSKLVPLLTAALQEALSKINALEARITQLESN
jgi:hypothetical protein